jgi:BioD-like phosphotransacetylase family protein
VVAYVKVTFRHLFILFGYLTTLSSAQTMKLSVRVTDEERELFLQLLIGNEKRNENLS